MFGRASSAGANDRPLILGAAAFAAAAIFYGAWLVWRAFVPLEITYDEAWNAWQAQAVMAARPLYPSPDALITNNYPPLSFYALGAAARLTGLDLILVGRLGSLLGLGATACAVMAIVRQLGGSRAAACLGAAWYLASIVRYCPAYVGMDDPTLLALGVMAWALVLFIRRHRAGRRTDLAIGLMVVAGFVKHILIATPVAALIWLWLEGDHRETARATVVGALGVAIGLALCTAAFGQAFVQQLFLYKRHIDLRMVWQAHPPLAKATWVAVLCSLLSTWRRGAAEAKLVFVYVVASLVTTALARTGDGVAVNSQFELILASAVGLALSLDKVHSAWISSRLGAQRVRWAIVAVLAVTVLRSTDPSAYLFWTSPGFHQATELQVRSTEAEIARLRSLPGPAFCPTMSVCFRAGKSFVYDSFAMDQRVATGFWSAARLERARAIAGVRTEPGTEVGQWDSADRTRSRPPSG
ncbi:MAG: hypothetical protein ACXU8Y_15960 [Caulobacteraceae bacterium]